MGAIDFSVSLTAKDWDGEVKAWRCPVLLVPGASVYDLFAGKRIDPDQYESNSNQAIIRWRGTDNAPERATAFVRLTKELSTEELTQKWRIAAILLPVVASLLVGVGGWFFGKQPQSAPIPTPLAASARFEKWTVSGRVDLSSSRAMWHEIGLTFQPPDLRLMQDGSFSTDIPVEVTSDGKHIFPSLIFRGVSNKDVPVVHLVTGGLGDMDYGVSRDDRVRDFKITKPIRFSPNPSSGYDADKTQKPDPGKNPEPANK